MTRGGPRRTAALMAAALGLAIGCTPTDDRPGGSRPRVVIPDAGAQADAGASPGRRAKRPRIELPPPVPPQPRVHGAPTGDADIRRMRDAARAGTPDMRPGAIPIRKVDDKRIEVGAIRVDTAARRIEVPARINMSKGILEYIAVTANGKLHESVLEMQAVPSHLHMAMLLLDLEPNEYVSVKPQGRRISKAGARVRMFVERPSTKAGKVERVPVESLLWNRKTKRPGKPAEWAFMGSIFWEASYSADSARSVIGLVPDDTCVIGATEDVGNPYRGEGLGFEVNTRDIPAVGTPVTLVIEPVAAPRKP